MTAYTNLNPNTVYYPYFGYVVVETTTYATVRYKVLEYLYYGIYIGSEPVEFNLKGYIHDDDLYYALHGCTYAWNYSPIITFRDYYDFAPGRYDGLAGIAVNTMWMAQEFGTIVPFYVYITY